jgi:predicted alpha/beta-fold hydrolase
MGSRGDAETAQSRTGRRRAGSVIERRHLRRIESDPEHAILSTPLKGRPVSVRPADGTVLHAEVFGSDGPWIVFAHGSTEALEVWTYVIRALSARGVRVIAYDLRGRARSGRAADSDYLLAHFGNDVEAVLATCVPDGALATVAGHSLGAMTIAAWKGSSGSAPAAWPTEREFIDTGQRSLYRAASRYGGIGIGRISSGFRASAPGLDR